MHQGLCLVCGSLCWRRSVLPVPWSFSITGLGAGIIISLIVAWANVFTSDLLIRQCYKAEVSGYEEIAYAAGGTFWLVSGSWTKQLKTEMHLLHAWLTCAWAPRNAREVKRWS